MTGMRSSGGPPALIGLDWGSSSLRAYLFGADGELLDARARPDGVLAITDRNFAAVLERATEGWQPAGAPRPVVACGMIGSTVGWREVPYLDCPAGPAEIGAALRAQAAAGGGSGLIIVPGLKLPGSPDDRRLPDVMRGEETQLIGALTAMPELAAGGTMILPGTHSKWVTVAGGTIERFRTYMTGELYAVLSEHSILGRPARSAAGRAETPGGEFERGVRVAAAARQGVAEALFSTRSLVLEGRLPPAASLDYLSGLLIGDEIRSGLAGRGSSGAALALIGDQRICALYQRAMRTLGQGEPRLLGDSAAAGLWHLATAAGLTKRD